MSSTCLMLRIISYILKGIIRERTEVRFKTIFDFKFAYAHEVWPKPDGSRILVNYVRTRRFRIYDLSARLLHDVS